MSRCDNFFTGSLVLGIEKRKKIVGIFETENRVQRDIDVIEELFQTVVGSAYASAVSENGINVRKVGAAGKFTE